MSFRIEVDEVFQVVRVEASGDLNPDVGLQIAGEATAVAEPHGIKRFLYDFREMVPRSIAAEVYQLPSRMGEAGMDRSQKIAVVYTGDEERFRYFETVVRNAGFEVFLFTDIDDAMQWLIGDGGS
ncbi:MAG: STAS/SEC14 domain-containing protein [bacterium]|nr:STAS/SEC14 domain-containing protein [bacterium]